MHFLADGYTCSDVGAGLVLRDRAHAGHVAQDRLLVDQVHVTVAVDVAEHPAGTVNAEIIDARAKPPKVKILEGKFAQQETILPKVELQNLGLSTGSIVYVKLVEQKGRLVKAEYAGKSG